MNTRPPKQIVKPYKLKSDGIRHRYILKIMTTKRENILSLADTLSTVDKIEVDEVKFHLNRTADIYIHTKAGSAVLSRHIESFFANLS